MGGIILKNTIEKLYTVQEACQILRLSRPTLMRILHSGLIPGAYRQTTQQGAYDGRGIPWKIPEAGILEYQRKNCVKDD